jgi:hypothetical protein
MALLFECMQRCARKMLDTSDIVREGMLRQPSHNFGVATTRPELHRMLAFPIVVDSCRVRIVSIIEQQSFVRFRTIKIARISTSRAVIWQGTNIFKLIN